MEYKIEEMIEYVRVTRNDFGIKIYSFLIHYYLEHGKSCICSINDIMREMRWPLDNILARSLIENTLLSFSLEGVIEFEYLDKVRVRLDKVVYNVEELP